MVEYNLGNVDNINEEDDTMPLWNFELIMIN